MKTNFKQCIGKVIAVAASLSNEKMIDASKIFQGTIFLNNTNPKGNIPTYQPPLILQYCKLFTYIQHSRHMDAACADCILHKIKESWKLHLDNSILIWFRVHHILEFIIYLQSVIWTKDESKPASQVNSNPEKRHTIVATIPLQSTSCGHPPPVVFFSSRLGQNQTILRAIFDTQIANTVTSDQNISPSKKHFHQKHGFAKEM